MNKEELKKLKEFLKPEKECDGCELPFKEVFEELYLFLKEIVKKYDKK